MAARLGWSRSTVFRAMGDLEVDGRLWRWKSKGRKGVLVLLAPDAAAGSAGKYAAIQWPTTGRRPLPGAAAAPIG
jgi:hypothetical protein